MTPPLSLGLITGITRVSLRATTAPVKKVKTSCHEGERKIAMEVNGHHRGL
jgi:hypothetical protein